ncbi:MAG: phytoene desaturase family protein [Balneolaceae bacterium]|jgi:phytoene desaturase
MDIKIIGAGLGGLAASCLLATKGHNVTILEKNEHAGGKINQVTAKGFRFDTGPSLLTMPFILESLFEFCGDDIGNYLDIYPQDPICKYFYRNGTQFSCFQDTNLNVVQIQEFAPGDVAAYKDFLEYSGQLYERTKEAFLFNPLYGLSDLASLNLFDFLKIDAFKTVSERVDDVFESKELRQFFKRFTTYNGSSPFQAPATLNVIPHVELTLGGYYIDGGIYALITALKKLCNKLGVVITYRTEIKNITSAHGHVTGLTNTTGEHIPADMVISNADASETYLHLFDDNKIPGRVQKRISNLEPSCSGFVVLLGIDKSYAELSHHNIFFSRDYEEEFHQIFKEKTMPRDPTIYIANTSFSNPRHAPNGGSNLFVLVNAPYLSNNYEWENQKENYMALVIDQLEERGLASIRDHIIYSECITPRDFQTRYRSNKGSIYGTSSNSKLSAFMRPRNKSRAVSGLYLVGGSTHPGGGIPLVTLSAFHAAELIDRFEH